MTYTDDALIDLGIGITDGKYDKNCIESWIVKHKTDFNYKNS